MIAKIQILMIRKIKETCLYVNNLDESEDFYVNKLGFTMIDKKEGRHLFFRVGNEVLLCFNPEITKNDKQLPPHFAKGEQHVAFEVPIEDYDATKQKLQQLGILVIHEETWHSNIKSFYFKDPDNHLLEVVGEGLWDF